MERYSENRHRLFPRYEYENAEKAAKNTMGLLRRLASRLRKHRDPELRALAASCDVQAGYLALMEREKHGSELTAFPLMAAGTIFVSEKEDSYPIGEAVASPSQDS